MTLETAFTRSVGIEVPLICGAMYPCSNPELIAAVSAAGGIGIVQPISMVYVHGHDLRDGMRMIRSLPVSVIRTPYVERIGTDAGPLARWLLRNPRTKHWMRSFYAVRALRTLKHASLKGSAYRDYWQAGKSVETIRELESASGVVQRFASAIR